MGGGHRGTASEASPPCLVGERGVNAGALAVAKLIVRIMFSQVLICVWREVLEFIIHPAGGGHGPGRLPAPEPASWLY